MSDGLTDLSWMRRALTLASHGLGRTSPNPVVGAVIVREGQVLGEGFHRKAGLPHAEIEALNAAKNAGHDVTGATIYVTLEPCCHQGRTGPCTQALIRAGIGRVVFAQTDPNPMVAGKGQRELIAAGIPAEAGLLDADARQLNGPFNTWIVTRRPFVTLKLASSLDGRIARAPGERTAVTGPEVLSRVMALRDQHDLVLVGAMTARVDNPLLTVRDAAGRPAEHQPRRGVLDTRLDLPELRLFETPGALVITAAPTDHPRALALKGKGVVIVHTPLTPNGHLDIQTALDTLGALPQPVTSVLVEGGGALAASLLGAGLVDRLHLYVAPKVFGATGVPAVGPLSALADFEWTDIQRVGHDLELTLEPVRGRS